MKRKVKKRKTSEVKARVGKYAQRELKIQCGF